jgi:hypothetical protein
MERKREGVKGRGRRESAREREREREREKEGGVDTGCDRLTSTGHR